MPSAAGDAPQPAEPGGCSAVASPSQVVSFFAVDLKKGLSDFQIAEVGHADLPAAGVAMCAALLQCFVSAALGTVPMQPSP